MVTSLVPRAILAAALAAGGRASGADDLEPVKLRPAPRHPPVALVQGGRPRASIAVMVAKPSPALTLAIGELRECIEAATGAKLPVAPGRIDGPAIVAGDCEEAGREGLAGGKLPVEGFAVKTAPGRVSIVGHDAVIGERAAADGTAWGVFEFLRFVGVRWYWPADRSGRSIVPRSDLVRLTPALPAGHSVISSPPGGVGNSFSRARSGA